MNKSEVLSRIARSDGGVGITNLNGGPLGGSRNKIINGNHYSRLRGNTFAQASGVRNGADCWRMVGLGSSQIGLSIVEVGDGAYAEHDMKVLPVYSVTAGTGDSDNAFVDQQIEDARTLSSRKATLTFFSGAWGSSIAKLGWQVFQNFDDGSATQVLCAQGVINVGENLRHSFTFDMPSVYSKSFGPSNSVVVRFYLDTGPVQAGVGWPDVGRQTGEVWINHVSLVEGDATAEVEPFVREPFQQVLDQCQRYVQTVPMGTYARAVSTDLLSVFYPFVTPMRAQPSVSLIGTGAMRFDNGEGAMEASPTIYSSAFEKDGGRIFLHGFSGLTVGKAWPLAECDRKILLSAEF